MLVFVIEAGHNLEKRLITNYSAGEFYSGICDRREEDIRAGRCSFDCHSGVPLDSYCRLPKPHPKGSQLKTSPDFPDKPAEHGAGGRRQHDHVRAVPRAF
jgi:hypothetical protein